MRKKNHGRKMLLTCSSRRDDKINEDAVKNERSNVLIPSSPQKD
jgi:hypothetical protein